MFPVAIYIISENTPLSTLKKCNEYGVQPLTQYSTVGASTFQGKIMINSTLYRNIVSVSVFSVFVTVYLEAYHSFNQIF